ncbi:condensation protein [Streptomyces noursei]|uniref:condensation protein n=1 Tax=Streptomyces noursei TaxID=1971 RepID=UPI0035D88531
MTARLPFPLVDEISRHCLQDDTPETVHIEVHLPGRLHHEGLRTAFHQALARHPRVLVRQLPPRWWHRHYTWQLAPAPDVDPVAFPPPGPDALTRARTRALTDCPPLDAAPPVRLEVIDAPHTTDAPQPAAPTGTVLLLTLHHTALDAPAGLRILATTADLYREATQSGPTPPPPTPPPPTARAPRQQARSEVRGERRGEGRTEAERAERAEPAERAQRVASPAPAPLTPSAPSPPSALSVLSPPSPPSPPSPAPSPYRPGPLTRPARLTPDHTATTAAPHRSTPRSPRPGNGMLLAVLPLPARPHHTHSTEHSPPSPHTVNDQLLVATHLMATHWNALHDRPAAPVIVTMPIDDRPRGPHMPIGNGTRLTPVAFPPIPSRSTARPQAPTPTVTHLLHHTAARTRALKSATPGPQLGFPSAALKSLPLPVGARRALTRALRALAAPWTPTALLSNIGRVPYPLDFGDTGGRATAVWFSAPARMPRGLSITTATTRDGDRIHLALRWSRALLDDAAAARLLALFRTSLATTASATTPPPPVGSAPRTEGGGTP